MRDAAARACSADAPKSENPARIARQISGSERRQADDPARRHRSRADVKNIGPANFIGPHFR